MEYKGKFVVLTKKQGKTDLIRLPLGNTSVRGWVKDAPKIGEQFFLYAEKECIHKFSWTSKIVLIIEGHLITENSTYQIEEKELELQRKVEEDFSKVTRLEVIDHQDEPIGKAYIKRGCNKVELSLQDDGKTLKIFIG